MNCKFIYKFKIVLQSTCLIVELFAIILLDSCVKFDRFLYFFKVMNLKNK